MSTNNNKIKKPLRAPGSESYSERQKCVQVMSPMSSQKVQFEAGFNSALEQWWYMMLKSTFLCFSFCSVQVKNRVPSRCLLPD